MRNKTLYMPCFNLSTGKKVYENRKDPEMAYDISMGTLRHEIKEFLNTAKSDYKLLERNDLIWFFNHRPVGNPLVKQHSDVTEYWDKVELGRSYFETLPNSRFVFCVSASDRELDRIEEIQTALDYMIEHDSRCALYTDPHLVAIHTYNKMNWKDEWRIVSARHIRDYWENEYHDEVTAVNIAANYMRYDEVPEEFKETLGDLEDIMPVMPSGLELRNFLDPNVNRSASDLANLYDRHWQTKDYAGNPNRDPVGGTIDRHMSRATLHKQYGAYTGIVRKTPKNLYDTTDSYEHAEDLLSAYIAWIKEDSSHLKALMDEDDRLMVCPECSHGFSEMHGADKSDYPMLKCPRCGADAGHATLLFCPESFDRMLDSELNDFCDE